MPGAASGSGVGPSSSEKFDSSISRGLGGGGAANGTGGFGMAGAVDPLRRTVNWCKQAGHFIVIPDGGMRFSSRSYWALQRSQEIFMGASRPKSYHALDAGSGPE
jgi:hypothetical protein